MLPWGYERSLIRMQEARRLSIFACDATAVYSNVSMQLGAHMTRTVHADLHCKIGGQFMTALNTPIFKKVWSKIIDDGEFADHDWTAKVDPDAVFIPSRLFNTLHGSREQVWAQENNGSYLNNCKFGLHGPLEVFSRRAIQVYASERTRCEPPMMQEDFYMQTCLQFLGVKKVDRFELLSEASCASKTWHDCQSRHVSFHPFKEVEAWKTCMHTAESMDSIWWQPEFG